MSTWDRYCLPYQCAVRVGWGRCCFPHRDDEYDIPTPSDGVSGMRLMKKAENPPAQVSRSTHNLKRMHHSHHRRGKKIYHEKRFPSFAIVSPRSTSLHLVPAIPAAPSSSPSSCHLASWCPPSRRRDVLALRPLESSSTPSCPDAQASTVEDKVEVWAD